jgi:hypothetical protein
MRLLRLVPPRVGGEEITDGGLVLAANRYELLAMVSGVGQVKQAVGRQGFEERTGFTVEQVDALFRRVAAVFDDAYKRVCPPRGRVWLVPGFPPRRGTRLLYPDSPWTGGMELGGEVLDAGDVVAAFTRDDLEATARLLQVTLEEVEEWEFQTLLGVYTWEAQAVLDALRSILAETG